MARWNTARASCWSIARAGFAATTAPSEDDPDRAPDRGHPPPGAGEFVISHPRSARRQRHSERHLRGASGVGLYSDPPPPQAGAQARDDRSIRHLVRVSDVLPDLSLARRIGAFPAHRRDPHGLPEYPDHPHGASRDRSGAGHHHAQAAAFQRVSTSTATSPAGRCRSGSTSV